MNNNAIIIPRNEYDPELEQRVQYFCSITPDLPKNTRKPVRSKPIDSKDQYELEIWQREEYRRIREGHFGMSPKFYFWYNYVWIWDIETGLLRPEFRLCQQEWFNKIEECQSSQEWGLICVKRRRVGASWMEAADVLHDCITTPFFKAGMTSKTEDDAKELFKKVKFIYDNLPPWLRPTSSAGNTQTHIDFSYYIKDETGSRKKQGLQSEIKVKAPTDTGWEGFALRKWSCDEAGKVQGLRALYSMTNEVMRLGFKRIGTPVLYGTAGDIGKEGKDLREMWYNSDIHKLRKFFFGGWNGILVDDCGNDLKEEAIRWIVYERKKKEGLSSKEYNDFLQQYPLTVEEAFTSNESYGIGNQIKINAQINSLLENPVMEKRGYFMLDSDDHVIFKPNNKGACIIYEEPEPGMKNLCVAGLDPSDHDVEDVKKASSLSLFIMKKQHGQQPPKIVFKYTDRPNVPRDFYEQALLALLYYNNCKVLVERNKPGIVTYFDERGYKHLLQTEPKGLNRLIPGNNYNIGYYMTQNNKKYMEEMVSEYIEDHCDIIPCRSLLEQCKQYGTMNTDEVFGFGLALIFLREDKSSVKSNSIANKNIPSFGYKKEKGIIVLSR